MVVVVVGGALVGGGGVGVLVVVVDIIVGVGVAAVVVVVVAGVAAGGVGVVVVGCVGVTGVVVVRCPTPPTATTPPPTTTIFKTILTATQIRNMSCVLLGSGVAQWLMYWTHNSKVRGSKPRSAKSLGRSMVACPFFAQTFGLAASAGRRYSSSLP